MTLTEFLLARLAEDATPNPTLHDHRTCGLFRDQFGRECTCGWPNRVLAESEAKRWIVESLSGHPGNVLHGGVRGRLERAAVDATWEIAREGTLACLALPYADHPDFDPTWRL